MRPLEDDILVLMIAMTSTTNVQKNVVVIKERTTTYIRNESIIEFTGVCCICKICDPSQLVMQYAFPEGPTVVKEVYLPPVTVKVPKLAELVKENSTNRECQVAAQVVKHTILVQNSELGRLLVAIAPIAALWMVWY